MLQSMHSRSYPATAAGDDRLILDKSYVYELVKKATLWDSHVKECPHLLAEQQQQTKQQKSTLPVTPTVALAGSPTISDFNFKSSFHRTWPSRANPIVPWSNTVILLGLPESSHVHEIVHSVRAPGGIRYIRFFEPSKTYRGGDDGGRAVITFCTAEAADEYFSYVKQNGFFVSRKVADGFTTDAEGELVVKQGEFTVHWKQLPKVEVWRATEQGHHRYEEVLTRTSDSDFCEVNDEICCAGATRVIRLIGEPDEIKADLLHLKLIPKPGNNIETMFKNSKGQTVVRFFSIRDAIVAKYYFGNLVKYTTAVNGDVDYLRDKSDAPVKTLGWEAFNAVFQDRLIQRINNLNSDDDLDANEIAANYVAEQHHIARASVVKREAEFKCTFSNGSEEHYALFGDVSPWPAVPKKA